MPFPIRSRTPGRRAHQWGGVASAGSSPTPAATAGMAGSTGTPGRADCDARCAGRVHSRSRRLMFKAPVALDRDGPAEILRRRCIMLLTTKGRKSGLPRTRGVSFMPLDDHFVVFSGWGIRSDWYQNLLADPEVTLQIGRRRIPATAVPVADPDRTGSHATDLARRGCLPCWSTLTVWSNSSSSTHRMSPRYASASPMTSSCVHSTGRAGDWASRCRWSERAFAANILRRKCHAHWSDCLGCTLNPV
jgi:deazaflavin-dependent oxidoreductase (nitroreductase family)